MTRFLSILTIMILALFAAALVLPAVIDWNTWKPEIQEQLSRRLGYPVRIDGSLSVVLLPVPSVRMTEVAIGGADPQTQPLTLKGLEAAIAVAPLLSGEIRATRITLKEPEIRFERSDDSTLRSPVLTALAQAAPASLRLDEVEVRGGRLIAAVNAAGRQWQADIITATIGADSLTGPWRAQAELRIAGIPVALDISTGRRDAEGGMPLSSTITLDGGARFIATGTVDWESGLLEGRIRGSMDAPKMTLAADLRGDADGIRFDSVKVESAGQSFSGTARVDRGRVNGGGRPRVTVAMEAESLALNSPAGETLTGGVFTGEAGLLPAAVFAGLRGLAGHEALSIADWSVSLQAADFGWDGDGAEDVAVRLDAINGRISGDMTVGRFPGGGEATMTIASDSDSADRLTGALRLRGDDAGMIVGWLMPEWRASVPDDPAGAVMLDTRITVDPGVIRLSDLKVQSDIVSGDGRVSFARADVGPSMIDAEFSARHLEFDPLWRLLAPLRGDPQSTDMRLRLDAGRMQVAGEALSGVAIEGTLVNGRVMLERFRIDSLPGLMADLSPFEAGAFVIQPKQGAAALGIEARAGTPPSPLRLTADITEGEEGLSWRNLRVEHKDATVTGSGHLGGFVGRPALTAQLDFSGRFFRGGPLAQLAAGESEPGPWSGNAIDWDWITAWDIDVMATVNQLDFAPPVRMASARLIGGFEGLKLSGRALVADGTADFSMSLTPSPPRIIAALDLVDADAADLTRAVWGAPFLRGPMDVSLRIDGAGNSGLTLISSLHGDGRFNVADGVLRGVDMPVLAISLPETHTLEDLSVLMATTVGAGETPFREFGGRITLEDGVVESTPIMRMDGNRGRAILVADLTRLIVDGSLELSFDNPVLPPLGIVATGDFTTPDVAFETQAIERIIGDEILDQLLEGVPGEGLPEELLEPEGG